MHTHTYAIHTLYIQTMHTFQTGMPYIHTYIHTGMPYIIHKCHTYTQVIHTYIHTYIHIHRSHMRRGHQYTQRPHIHSHTQRETHIHTCMYNYNWVHTQTFMHACIIIIYQCCVAIFIQGIHIGSAHIMQDLSCTISPCHLKTTLPYTTYSANLKLQASPHSLLTATTTQSPSYLTTASTARRTMHGRARCAANIHAQTCIHNYACMYNYNYAHAQKQVHAHTCMYNNYACTQS